MQNAIYVNEMTSISPPIVAHYSNLPKDWLYFLTISFLTEVG